MTSSTKGGIVTDEEAMFEVWFQMQRRKDWERLNPKEAFHESWGMGFREQMLKAWLARASLHVSLLPSNNAESN